MGSATTPRGLGLGLFIAQQIVQAHSGGIAIRSQNDHTTFTVRLPR
jgi:nitrogen-specific signal transduction histidine kinase